MNHPQCVGCGFCCLQATCFLGVSKHGTWKGKCKSLVWNEDNNRYYCQQYLDSPESCKALFVGYGCASGLNSWRKEVKNRG